MKYRIEKRTPENSKDDEYSSIRLWPWRLVYPDGTKLMCFSHSSAVESMNRALRCLRSEKTEFLRQARKAYPGPGELIVRKRPT